MTKLNQIVAVVAGKKTRTEKDFGDLNKIVQKPDLFNGLLRTYQPLDDSGEQQPPEQKFPQKNVKDVIGSVKEILSGIFDAIATQEYGNQKAHADVKVDGQVIVKNAPVTVLLYLEKQLNDLHTFVNNLPILDPSERWVYDTATGEYTTETVKTVRTKKVNKPIVLYPHSVEHPAQTQMVTEDVAVGHWNVRKSATAISAKDKQSMLSRIIQLQDAVKIAREEANSTEVEQIRIADPILRFVFGT